MCIKNFLLSVVLLTFLISCGSSSNTDENAKRDTVYVNDYNVLLVPDLSNRINQNIHPKPVHDTMILSNILDNIKVLVDLKGRSLNQWDIYKFDFINKSTLNNSDVCRPEELEINLLRFKGKLAEAASYLRDSIDKDIYLFKSNVRSIYNYSINNSAGADLWNYFNETITTSLKLRELEDITSPTSTVLDPIVLKRYKNVVVLFTDGYIENANKANGYVFDPKLITKIRKEYNASGQKDLEKFILSNQEYLLRKTTNDLKGVNVLVLEMIDRSLDKNGVAKHHPTDFQIMKLIWKEWLTASGADMVEVHQAVKKKDEGYALVKSFMEKL